MIWLYYSFLGGEACEAGKEPILGKSKDYADCMTCTFYASVSGTSEYRTRLIEPECVRRSFESLVGV